MATVNGLTAARMLEIEAASVVNGNVVGESLILTTKGGTVINAGNVKGNAGEGAYLKEVILPALKMVTMGPSRMLTSIDNASANVRKVRWSPDGSFFAANLAAAPHFEVWSFNGMEASKLSPSGISLSVSVNDFAWHPTGRYLAVACATGQGVRVYEFNGVTFTEMAAPANLPPGVASSLAWSPDGRNLMVLSSNAPFWTLYRFNNGALTRVTTTPALSVAHDKIDWCPNNRYIALAKAGSGANRLTLYTFDGSLPSLAAEPTLVPTGLVYEIRWSPDGKNLAVSASAAPRTSVYTLAADTLVKTTNPTAIASTATSTTYWSPDGRYLGVMQGTERYWQYKFENNLLGGLYGNSYFPALGTSADWSPDGQFIIVGGPASSNRVALYATDATYFTDGSYAIAHR